MLFYIFLNVIYTYVGLFSYRCVASLLPGTKNLLIQKKMRTLAR